jgi:hypothetical protein
MANDPTTRLLASAPVSILAPAPRGTDDGAPAPPPRSSASIALTGNLVAGLGVAAALVALVFLTSSGIDQTVTADNTWSQIAITFLGAGACGAVVLTGGRGRAWGAPAVAIFAAFTAFAALSIAWSVQPDWSWFGANQLLSYLSAFAGAVALGRLAPGRWPAVVGGVATAATALCAYSLLAKVFPSTLASTNVYGRVLAPFGYWNAIGLSGAMGLVPALWAATRRMGPVALRGLAVPAMTLMISVVVLSYSRSALLVAAVGVAAWVAFVPLRLRSALMFAAAALWALPIAVVALHNHNLTGNNIGLAAQDAAGHAFGPVALGALVAAVLTGIAISVAMNRIAVPEWVRRRIGGALLGGVALLPVLAIVALAVSSRGLFGEISHAWQSLISPNSVVGDTVSRFTQVGSSRPLYWQQGLDVGVHALLKGAGELGYGVARLRYTTSGFKTDQAHSYVVQTFADLGLIGIALSVALLVAWSRAAVRPLAIAVRWRSLTEAQATERTGMAALAIVVLVFGIHSTLDFTFYFPGLTIPALLCAGWLAGRGPLDAPVGRATKRISVIDRPGAGALVTGLAAVALIGGWLMWQPLRSTQALNDAENNPARAFASARAAASNDPLAIEPRYLLSVLYQNANDPNSARAQLIKATQTQPQNPMPWLWLGQLNFQIGHPRDAIIAMSRVLALDHPLDNTSFTAHSVITAAGAQLAKREAAAAKRSVSSRARRRARAARRAGHRLAHRRTRP